MKFSTHKVAPAPLEAFMARPITTDLSVLNAYFAQVKSYEANERARDQKIARFGCIIGCVGIVVGVLGIIAVAVLTPLKTVVPLVFRVDKTSGVIERIYDIQSNNMKIEERIFCLHSLQ